MVKTIWYVSLKATQDTEILRAGTTVTEIYDDTEKALARLMEIDRTGEGTEARMQPAEGWDEWERVNG